MNWIFSDFDKKSYKIFSRFEKNILAIFSHFEENMYQRCPQGQFCCPALPWFSIVPRPALAGPKWFQIFLPCPALSFFASCPALPCPALQKKRIIFKLLFKLHYWLLLISSSQKRFWFTNNSIQENEKEIVDISF